MPRVAFFTCCVLLSGLLNLLIASAPTVMSFRQTVGPPIMFAPPEAQRFTDVKGRLIVVNWNVHVGHGQVTDLIEEISRTEERNGFGKPEFVLLLEETFRQSENIPASTGFKVPRRIEPPPASMDIEALAHKLGWWLYYAPSMRNGSDIGEHAQDRGNAILSSLPLKDLQSVELPFAVQRRVALIATVTDYLKQPKLRVAVTHFDTRAPLLYGWILGGPRARNNQAKGFVSALEKFAADRMPIVVGGDLNTYLGSKAVIDIMSEVATHTNCGNQATHTWGLALDHIFTNIPGTWQGQCARGSSAFGSDHYPLVLSLNLEL
jgi:endonuclease/exonuclease/phosphatase family metal-dependent hydrolase